MVRKMALNMSLFCFAGLLLFAAGEGMLRAYQAYKSAGHSQQPRVSKPSPIYLDEKIGWRSTEHFVYEATEKDASGKAYPVRYESGPYGFRVFGDLQTNKPKLLFLGDSYTQAKHVSNEKVFYSVVKEMLPVEVFAYGASGYGTLQEYMILDEYIDMIKPSILVWQYCGNDFINNSYDLEKRSYNNNNGLRRPYLTREGEIIYRIPQGIPFLHEIANRYSRFLYIILSRIDMLSASLSKNSMVTAWRGETIEKDIGRAGNNHQMFREAAEITNDIMRMVRNRSHHLRILAFSVDDEQPYYDEFKRLSSLNGIEFIDGIPQALRAAEEQGLVTRASDDAHWNELGHRLAAEKIIDYLKTRPSAW